MVLAQLERTKGLPGSRRDRRRESRTKSLLGSQASTMPLTSDRVEFTGEAAERISEALVSAFPNISALRRMVRIVLSSPLNHYANPSQPIQYVVLDLDWDLIAIHHHGDDFTNHGTPMSDILNYLQTEGKESLIG